MKNNTIVKQVPGGNIKRLAKGAYLATGKTHKQGGINIGVAEIEDQEVIVDNDNSTTVFSDALGYAKKAKQLAKAKGELEDDTVKLDRQITNMKSNSTDPIYNNTKKRLIETKSDKIASNIEAVNTIEDGLNVLSLIQEQDKQQQGIQPEYTDDKPSYGVGGFFKKLAKNNPLSNFINDPTDPWNILGLAGPGGAAISMMKKGNDIKEEDAAKEKKNELDKTIQAQYNREDKLRAEDKAEREQIALEAKQAKELNIKNYTNANNTLLANFSNWANRNQMIPANMNPQSTIDAIINNVSTGSSRRRKLKTGYRTKEQEEFYNPEISDVSNITNNNTTKITTPTVRRTTSNTTPSTTITSDLSNPTTEETTGTNINFIDLPNVEFQKATSTSYDPTKMTYNDPIKVSLAKASYADPNSMSKYNAQLNLDLATGEVTNAKNIDLAQANLVDTKNIDNLTNKKANVTLAKTNLAQVGYDTQATQNAINANKSAVNNMIASNTSNSSVARALMMQNSNNATMSEAQVLEQKANIEAQQRATNTDRLNQGEQFNVANINQNEQFNVGNENALNLNKAQLATNVNQFNANVQNTRNLTDAQMRSEVERFNASQNTNMSIQNAQLVNQNNQNNVNIKNQESQYNVAQANQFANENANREQQVNLTNAAAENQFAQYNDASKYNVQQYNIEQANNAAKYKADIENQFSQYNTSGANAWNSNLYNQGVGLNQSLLNAGLTGNATIFGKKGFRLAKMGYGGILDSYYNNKLQTHDIDTQYQNESNSQYFANTMMNKSNYYNFKIQKAMAESQFFKDALLKGVDAGLTIATGGMSKALALGSNPNNQSQSNVAQPFTNNYVQQNNQPYNAYNNFMGSLNFGKNS